MENGKMRKFNIGDKLYCINKVVSISSDEVLLDEFEEFVIYNIRPNIQTQEEISVINEKITYTFSNIKGTPHHIDNYFITLPEYRKMKINKILNDRVRRTI